MPSAASRAGRTDPGLSWILLLLAGVLTFVALVGTPLRGTTPPGAEALIEELQRPDPAHWKATVGRLVALGPVVVPSLIQALSHEHRAVREGAAHALGDLGSASAPAVDALVVAFEDPDDFVRWKAARALGFIGPAAARAQAALEPAANSQQETEIVRASAQAALQRIRQP
jgi:HEAT repeat protein